MTTVQTDFTTRVEEVSRYFLFLREFQESRVSFSAPPESASPFISTEKDALFKTLKANGFLLLYNLVESTLKNAIEAIFDDLQGKAISFDACRKEIRKIVLSNLKKHDVDTILPKIATISTDVIAHSFRKNELFSGNVDGRRVRAVAGAYGFKNPAHKSDELLTVKTHRNDLAHGIKSFADVGRDFDLARLETIHAEVVGFMKELLVNIATYIANKEYLI
jgi:hypothetical protein